MDSREFFMNAKANGLSKEQAIAIWESMPESEAKEPSKASEFMSRVGENVGNIAQGVGGYVKRFAGGVGKSATDLISPILPEKARENAYADFEQMEGKPGFGLGELFGNIATALPGAGVGGMAAKTALKGAPALARAAGVGAGMGVGSAATEVARDAVTGQEFDPGSAIGEVTLSTFLGGGGHLAGQGMKKAAPGLLEMLAPGTAALKESKNPPTREGYEMALEKGIVPMWGGFKKAAENIGKYMNRQTALREGFLDASGKRLYVKQIIDKAKKDIQTSISEGTQGVTPADLQATLKWLDDAAEMARKRPSYNPKNGTIAASDAVKFKTSIMKNAKPVMGEAQEGRKLASEASGRAVNKGLEELFQGTGAGKTLDRLQGNLKQAAPIREALEDRASKNISPWELRADIATAAGSIPAAMYNPWLALPLLAPSALSAARHSPGSAAALYRGGKSLMNPSVMRDLEAQALRTLSFQGEK